MSVHPKAITASRTLTPSDAETACVVNAAAGLTLTLPEAVGSGMEFTVVIGTTVTESNVVISSGASLMTGLAISALDDVGDALMAFETAADTNTITLDGSIKAGIKGDRFDFIDVASGLWAVDARVSATGDEVTMFSAV